MLSEKEVAALLGVSVAVLRKWRRFDNGPPWFRIGPSLIRYPRKALDEFIEAGRGQPDSRRH